MTETARKRTTIPDEVKAAALADLALMSPMAVAAKHGLKFGTVRSWKSRESPLTLSLQHVATQKRERIVALALEYLEASFNAQIAQAYVTSNPNYINRQPANDLAILHGVLGDKAVRLLEALQPHRAESE